MARMAALHFSIALVLMTMFSDCVVSLRITPSDVPTSLLPLPAKLTFRACFYHSHCQCDLEITSGGTSTPLACVRLIKSKESKATIHLSVTKGSCQEDNHNHNYTAVWPTAGGYGPDLYMRSENNELMVTLNERSQNKLTIPMSGTAQGLTVVTLIHDVVYISDVEVVGSCHTMTTNETWFRVQESDVILMKPKPNISEIEIRAKPLSGCETGRFDKGKHQVREQGWVRLELHAPKEKYSNINLTVNNQLVVTIPVWNSRCTGREWYDIGVFGADHILNCYPRIAPSASKICACKAGTCDTCVWVIIVLIAVLVFSGVVSVVVAYLNYKKKEEGNTYAFSLIETNKNNTY